jgi:hypothetical protein
MHHMQGPQSILPSIGSRIFGSGAGLQRFSETRPNKAKGKRSMTHDVGQENVIHSGVERRSGIDTRPLEEQQRIGERRSGLDRRQTSISAAEELSRQVQSTRSLEEKIDLLARATFEIAAALAAIERRIRVIQRNTANQGY